MAGRTVAARAAARREEEGQLGEAMRKLPNARQRAFVDFYLLEKPGRGAQTALRVGLATGNRTQHRQAWP
jgi:hypothetical protein